MRQKRLDEILIEKKWVADKKEAFVIVTEGRVFIEGQKAISPSRPVNPDARIEVRPPSPYVGRGAYKLKAALEKFHINANHAVCADIGAATGGFTQVLLECGAKKVYAIDTARGKMDYKLRQDPRIIVMDSTDVRNLSGLPEEADLVSIDVSLISLRDILGAVGRFLKEGGAVVALFKPQYEARDTSILRHGVVKNAEDRKRLLKDFISWTETNGWMIADKMESPIRGSEGNVEYLLYLQSAKR